MIKYKYTIYNDVSCDQDLFIHQVNADGQYIVEWENQVLGYIYMDSDVNLWKGSTVELNLIASKLGDWIAHSN